MKYLLLEREKDIAVLKINRPEALNSLNSDVLRELKETLLELNQDDKIRVLIITGSGQKAFIAGADIKEMKALDYDGGKEFAELGHSVYNLLEDSNKVVIAAINGFCLGGGNELALSCDIRLASDKAKFGNPEVGLGIIAGFGGTQRLTNIVGEARAKELLYTGKIIDALKAEKIGLVNRVVAEGQLLEETWKMARKIAGNAPLAVSKTKEAVAYGRRKGISAGLEREKELFASCFETGDQKRGMEGYLNKIDVKFEGK